MTEGQRQVLDMHRNGLKMTEIAVKLGISLSAVKHKLARARRWERLDPDMQSRLKGTGKTNIDNLHSFWDVRDDGDGGRTSLYYYLGRDDSVSFSDIVTETISDLFESRAPTHPPRDVTTSGDRLLVVDIADLHVGKLATKSETGFEYTRDIARHRAIEGMRELLRRSEGCGIGRILFVVGNDLVHIDTPRGGTTSGTPQDTDGSMHQMISDATAVCIDCIDMCAEVAPVDLIYAPSNHDWMTGFCIAQIVAAWFAGHPTVTATPYNMSERHRKYYRYENNLIGVTHGDGAKTADLYPLMITEARGHVSDCVHMYWYVHHIHHKQRRTAGVKPVEVEKDLIGMTVVGSGASGIEGHNAHIEHVRSPSPPDGWHDRNGYVNRQAVEAFVHDTTDGQIARFSVWF